jgi:hypothetical protein
MAWAIAPTGLATLVADAGLAGTKEDGTASLTCSPTLPGTGAGRSARMPMALRGTGFKVAASGMRCG